MPENLHLELDEEDKKAKDEGEEKGILNFSYQWGKIMKGADAAFKAVDKAAKESKNTVKKAPQALAAKPEPQQAAHNSSLDLQAMPDSTPSLDSDNYEITVPLHELPYSISGHVNPGMNIEHIQVAEVAEDGNLSEWSDVDDFDAASGNFDHELQQEGEYIFSSVDTEGNRSEQSETLFLDVEAYMAAPTEGDEEEPNSGPEFNGPILATVNGETNEMEDNVVGTGSGTSVTFEIPVLDVNDDEITVNVSFIGDNLGCTIDTPEQVVNGEGNVVFTLTPELFNQGNIQLKVQLTDPEGEVVSQNIGVGIS